ncbi:MAG: hypothetical protein QOG57_5931, partial [Pseudonocardiales bacterium]|nr:hypothetical protein [Pseudonocardiales bacterium]
MSISNTEREVQRQAITEHFLTALEQVVWRYRAMEPPAQ